MGIQNNSRHTDLGEVELKRIVSGQRHHEASGQVLRQRVTMVAEEEAVVTQWWHGDPNLSQVVEILQHWGLMDIKQSERDKQVNTAGSTSLSFMFQQHQQIFTTSA